MLDFSKGALPLYSQIKNILLEKIDNEEYVPGDIIPSEAELQKKFNVSRITVRQAINELVVEGYLSRQRGIGTVVISNKIEEKLSKVMSFTNEMKSRGLEPSTKYAEIGMEKANKKVAKALEINPGDYVYKLVRIRCADGEPIVVFITYLKEDLDLSLDKENYYGSLYELIHEKNNRRVTKVKEFIEATISGTSLSEMLDIEDGSPILKRIRTSFDQNHRTLEYTESFYRSDKYRYYIELSG